MSGRFAFCLSVAVAWISCAALAQELPPPPPPVVREVVVEFVGPETVNRSVVTANIQTAVGQPASREVIEQDVRNLINTGYFFDVRVLEERLANGIKVVFRVQGKATLREVTIEGNKQFKEDRLRREITQKPGDILDEHKAHVEAQKIVELYQKAGYPEVKVTPETAVDRDTGKAVLRYKVQEGPRTFIKKIKLHGNKAVRAGVLLKLMKTKRHWWLAWLSGAGVLKDEQLRDDLEKLREYYRDHGYIDVEIAQPRVERVSPKWLVVHLDIFEGQQYKVGEVKFENVKLFPVADIERKLKMTTGRTFTPAGLEADTKAIEDYYGARGYLDTHARANRVPNVETGRMDLTYVVREGALTYIEKIEIRGNTKTKDKVLRRELAVAPGDIYDTVRVSRSADRLRNLGFFSKVETAPETTSVPNHKDLAITVEEQRTGSLTFGAGFSSIDNLVGFVEMQQGNFDLFNWPNFTGAGQKLRLRAQVGLERQDYVLSFTEPWFLDRQLSLGFDLYHRYSGYLSGEYDETRTGGAVRLGKALNQFLRAEVQYSLQRIEQNITSTNVSAEIRSQDGSALRSSLVGTLTYDTRDNVFLTTRGQRTEFSAEIVGGPVGGDISIYKLNLRSAVYFPLFNGHVLQLVGAAGVVDAFGQTKGSGGSVTETNGETRVVNDVPMFDRYFLGGANTLRGFDYRDVGPKDVYGEPVGGNTYFNGTIEYTIPVVERVRFALFFDVGEVDADAYKLGHNILADVGAGVRLNLPVGPLRLDYGWPIITDDRSGKTGRIQFSVGYQF